MMKEWIEDMKEHKNIKNIKNIVFAWFGASGLSKYFRGAKKAAHAKYELRRCQERRVMAILHFSCS